MTLILNIIVHLVQNMSKSVSDLLSPHFLGVCHQSILERKGLSMNMKLLYSFVFVIIVLNHAHFKLCHNPIFNLLRLNKLIICTMYTIYFDKLEQFGLLNCDNCDQKVLITINIHKYLMHKTCFEIGCFQLRGSNHLATLKLLQFSRSFQDSQASILV